MFLGLGIFEIVGIMRRLVILWTFNIFNLLIYFRSYSIKLGVYLRLCLNGRYVQMHVLSWLGVQL